MHQKKKTYKSETLMCDCDMILTERAKKNKQFLNNLMFAHHYICI